MIVWPPVSSPTTSPARSAMSGVTAFGNSPGSGSSSSSCPSTICVTDPSGTFVAGTFNQDTTSTIPFSGTVLYTSSTTYGIYYYHMAYISGRWYRLRHEAALNISTASLLGYLSGTSADPCPTAVSNWSSIVVVSGACVGASNTSGYAFAESTSTSSVQATVASGTYSPSATATSTASVQATVVSGTYSPSATATSTSSVQATVASATYSPSATATSTSSVLATVVSATYSPSATATSTTTILATVASGTLSGNAIGEAQSETLGTGTVSAGATTYSGYATGEAQSETLGNGTVSTAALSISTIDFEATILALTPANGTIAFGTDTNYYYVYDSSLGWATFTP